MQEPVSPIQITLPVRQLVEFLRRVGSIDNRFTGFDRANEGARIHRKLQRAAVKEHADYAAEVFLRGIFAYEEIEFTLEGRADGIFTAADGVTVVDEIKTTACPAADITRILHRSTGHRLLCMQQFMRHSMSWKRCGFS